MQPISPDPVDYEEVAKSYSAASDAEKYRLAQAAKLIRLAQRDPRSPLAPAR